MVLLKETKSYRVDTEKEAVTLIEREKERSLEEGEAFTIAKASYTYKKKKRKDEIIEAYVVDLTYSYQGIWDDLVEGY